MFKRLTCLFIAVFSLFVCVLSNAADNVTGEFDEDYFVGLKAFDDGFYDVAKLSLEDFLGRVGQSERTGFAAYLVYRIYMIEKNYEKAGYYLNGLSSYDDKRFDKEAMKADAMTVAVNTDCGEAGRLLSISDSSVQARIYAESSCPLDRDSVARIASGPFGTEPLYAMLKKTAKDAGTTEFVYSSLSDDKKTPEVMNYFGRYFAALKKTDLFEEVYSIHKDGELVSIALDNLWQKNDYNGYLELFGRDVKESYSIGGRYYCRLIEASGKTSSRFDCSAVDRCFSDTGKDFKQAKLSCLLKNGEKDNASAFMTALTAKDGRDLCSLARYMISNKLYVSSDLDRFSLCPQKTELFETLYKEGDSEGVRALASGDSSQEASAYLALAARAAGDEKSFSEYLNGLKDKALAEMVRSRAGINE